MTMQKASHFVVRALVGRSGEILGGSVTVMHDAVQGLVYPFNPGPFDTVDDLPALYRSMVDEQLTLW
jgi:hypothetical protein